MGTQSSTLERARARAHQMSDPKCAQTELLRRNVKRFRGGVVSKAHRLLYHSTLGLSVIKKKKTEVEDGRPPGRGRVASPPLSVDHSTLKPTLLDQEGSRS